MKYFHKTVPPPPGVAPFTYDPFTYCPFYLPAVGKRVGFYHHHHHHHFHSWYLDSNNATLAGNDLDLKSQTDEPTPNKQGF